LHYLEVVRYIIENPNIISNSKEDLSLILEKYITDLGYNILTKSVNYGLIHYLCQTNDGV